MTVKELSEYLSKQDPTLLVFVEGYEGGLADIREPVISSVKLNRNTESWYGPHEVDEDGVVNAIVLHRAENLLSRSI